MIHYEEHTLQKYLESLAAREPKAEDYFREREPFSEQTLSPIMTVRRMSWPSSRVNSCNMAGWGLENVSSAQRVACRVRLGPRQ